MHGKEDGMSTDRFFSPDLPGEIIEGDELNSPHTDSRPRYGQERAPKLFPRRIQSDQDNALWGKRFHDANCTTAPISVGAFYGRSNKEGVRLGRLLLPDRNALLTWSRGSSGLIGVCARVSRRSVAVLIRLCLLRSRGAGCAAYATRSGRRSTHLRSRARLRSLAQISNAVVKQPDLDASATNPLFRSAIRGLHDRVTHTHRVDA